MIRAHDVFDEIVQSAWETGDPGIVFIDRINTARTQHLISVALNRRTPVENSPFSPTKHAFWNHSTLVNHVKQPQVSDQVMKDRNMQQSIGFQKLARDIRTAVRFLDNAIDVNKYPVPEIEQMHKGNRKIGLGVMGWADMLILLGIPYNSRKAFRLARELMKFITSASRQESVELAAVRGVFPNFKGCVYDVPGMPRVRNATSGPRPAAARRRTRGIAGERWQRHP